MSEDWRCHVYCFSPRGNQYGSCTGCSDILGGGRELSDGDGNVSSSCTRNIYSGPSSSRIRTKCSYNCCVRRCDSGSTSPSNRGRDTMADNAGASSANDIVATVAAAWDRESNAELTFLLGCRCRAAFVEEDIGSRADWIDDLIDGSIVQQAVARAISKGLAICVGIAQS
jgi:hypothetical protein